MRELAGHPFPQPVATGVVELELGGSKFDCSPQRTPLLVLDLPYSPFLFTGYNHAPRVERAPLLTLAIELAFEIGSDQTQVGSAHIILAKQPRDSLSNRLRSPCLTGLLVGSLPARMHAC